MEIETQPVTLATSRMLTDAELAEVNGGSGHWNRVLNVAASAPILVIREPAA